MSPMYRFKCTNENCGTYEVLRISMNDVTRYRSVMCLKCNSPSIRVFDAPMLKADGYFSYKAK